VVVGWPWRCGGSGAKGMGARLSTIVEWPAARQRADYGDP